MILSTETVIEADGDALPELQEEAEELEAADLVGEAVPVANNTVGDARSEGVAVPESMKVDDTDDVPESDGEAAATVPDGDADVRRTDAEGRCVADTEGETRRDGEPVLVPVTHEETDELRVLDGEDVELFEITGEGVGVLERIIVRDSRGELDTVPDESCDFVPEDTRDRDGLTLPVVLRESASEAVLETLVLRDSKELADVLLDGTGDREPDELARGERVNVGEPDEDLDVRGERVALGLRLLEAVTEGVCDED